MPSAESVRVGMVGVVTAIFSDGPALVEITRPIKPSKGLRVKCRIVLDRLFKGFSIGPRQTARPRSPESSTIQQTSLQERKTLTAIFRQRFDQSAVRHCSVSRAWCRARRSRRRFASNLACPSRYGSHASRRLHEVRAGATTGHTLRTESVPFPCPPVAVCTRRLCPWKCLLAIPARLPSWLLAPAVPDNTSPAFDRRRRVASESGVQAPPPAWMPVK
jgi:hypothetical protein